MDDRFEEKSPQLLPGREKPPVPPDDREKAGLSLGEIIKDKIGEITTGMKDNEELKDKEGPVAAPGGDDFLKKDASRAEKKRGDYTQVTTLSYDEVDPS